MNNNSKIQPFLSIVVPVYNEEREVKNTAEKLKEISSTLPFSTELIFVNDGSVDNTKNILSTLPFVDTVTHPFNRGYGAALRSGLDRAKGSWIAIVDCDGTYPLNDLAEMAKMAQSEPDLHMVVGARKISFRVRFPLHNLARWILRRMVKALTGVMVPDLNSGMRVFRRSLYREFKHLLPYGFSFTTTITVAALFSGYFVKYVPIEYGVRTGRSHIRPVRDFIAFVILITRLASYFDPLRFFLPLALWTFGFAVLRAVRDIYVTNSIGSAAVILVSIAINAFLVGVIADVIVKRSHAPILDTQEKGSSEH